MITDFAPKLAQLMTSHTIPIQKGDFVVIQTTTEAIPMVEALAAAVVDKGGIPHMVLNLPTWEEYWLIHGSDDQLSFINPINVAIYEKADVLFNIDAPSHASLLTSIPIDKVARSAAGQQAVQQIFFRRLTEESLRWNSSTYPTAARAQQANMGYYAYQQFLYQAYALHLDDPAQYWRDLQVLQERYTHWLMQKSQIRVAGPGIAMQFECRGRNWYSAHGIGNLPDGEILTCPIEETVNGYVEFSYPAYHRGKRIDGVRLVFKDGIVVEASASKGEDLLLNQLNTDENARRLGEFAIGTNEFIQNVIGFVLLDEKVGGTIHMALGNSAAPAEGKNTSRIHWDIVHNMREGGEIYADDELFYQNGKFLIN